jgi:hypothetical protein
MLSRTCYKFGFQRLEIDSLPCFKRNEAIKSGAILMYRPTKKLKNGRKTWQIVYLICQQLPEGIILGSAISLIYLLIT